MRYVTTLLCAVLIASTPVVVLASAGNGPGNGPGPIGPQAICPNPTCPDHDADGICNGQDIDYVPQHTNCPNPDCPAANGGKVCTCADLDDPLEGAGVMFSFQQTLRAMFGWFL